MAASIRGHQAQMKVFLDGRDTAIVNIVNFEVNMDSTFSRSNYVGAAVPEGDQSIDGWSGTMEAEVKGPEIDDLIDAITNQNQSGIGVSDITIVDTELYADGRLRSYVYFDLQIRMSKRQAGLTEKVTKRLEFQASGRIPL